MIRKLEESHISAWCIRKHFLWAGSTAARERGSPGDGHIPSHVWVPGTVKYGFLTLCRKESTGQSKGGKGLFREETHSEDRVWTISGMRERLKWSLLKTKAWGNIQIFMLYREVQSQSIQVEEEGMWDREVWKKTKGEASFSYLLLPEMKRDIVSYLLM